MQPVEVVEAYLGRVVVRRVGGKQDLMALEVAPNLLNALHDRRVRLAPVGMEFLVAH